jgi:hypothetical protein
MVAHKCFCFFLFHIPFFLIDYMKLGYIKM